MLLCARLASVLRCGWDGVSILLGFGQRAHVDVVLLEPPRNRVRVAPFVFGVTVNLGYLHCAELLFDVFLIKPISVLIECFMA